MVKATTSLDTRRENLKSIEGGWVELREMSYGDFLKRRDMAMKMGMSGFGTGSEANSRMDIDIIQEHVTRFEFKICIVDHNLEDENGRKLALSTEKDFNQLDPKIGQEISSLIEKMIQWEDPKSEGSSSGDDREDDNISEDSETDL